MPIWKSYGRRTRLIGAFLGEPFRMFLMNVPDRGFAIGLGMRAVN
jgi:hypothetical protein